MARSFGAQVNSIIAALQEWDRGAIPWAECLRRCDCTEAGNKILESYWLSRRLVRDRWEFAAAAVRA